MPGWTGPLHTVDTELMMQPLYDDEQINQQANQERQQ